MPRLTDPLRLQKEIDAQKKRAEALALLSSQGGERHYKPGEVRKAREEKPVDNTLEVVTLRRAQQTYQELSAKDRLLQQQNSVREDVQRKQELEGKPAGATGATGGALREGWKEVKDAKTGATYYWNKSENKTSWKRPEASPEELSKLQTSGKAGGGHGVKKERGGDAQKGKTDGGKPSPLPAGWTEVKDPKSGGVYFWNKAKGATTWVRPTPSGNEGASSASDQSTPGLPEGWKAVTHAATGQSHYVNEASGERSFTFPGSQPAAAAVSERRGKGGASHDERGTAASSARGREGRDRGGGERPKKKGRGGGWAIDPLDPTGKTGGKWSEGLVQVGERMADSTASGPLWQQRPYPAPGKILRGREPTDAETAGPRQR
ncbi:unnamed protein product [Laminaria digitata]